MQAELRFVAHNKDEKTAGVWVDGQYVGYVKELTGEKKLVLLPGKHEVIVRQAWFDELVEQVILETGAGSGNQRQPGQVCAHPAGRSDR